VRLGYRYLSLKGAQWDEDNNIFSALFHEAVTRINPNLGEADVSRLLTNTKLLLNNEDLGKTFYE
jgi:type I restriction enzyme, R subunit